MPQQLVPAVQPPSRRRRAILVFLAGIAMTAGITAVGMVMLIRNQSAPAAAPTTTIRMAPAQVVQAVKVADPPAPIGSDVDPSVSCAEVRANATPTDHELRVCAARGELGRCHLYGTESCPQCACRHYVGVDGLCGKEGCGAPLSGTGCADGGFYARRPEWKCATGDEAACMLRRLTEWQLCAP